MSKVVVVTGGCSGIGKATAELFGAKGWTVIIMDINDDGHRIANQIHKNLGNGMFLKVDVGNYNEVEQAVTACWETYGHIDGLVNNAGILTAEDSPVEIARTIDVNVKGPVFLSHLVVPLMIKSGGGSIINMGSITGQTGSPGFPVYSATKAAQIGFTKSLARKYGRNHIRANCICPGSITGTGLLRSNLKHELSQVDYARLMQKIPIGRVGKPSDVAQVAYFLASPEAAHITGATIIVDGGEIINV